MVITCASCGGEMAVGAKFCPGCGLAQQGGIVSAPPTASGDAIGIVLALAPLVGAALCWFWVAASPLLTAGSNLNVVFALVIIGTAVMAAIDANARRFGLKGGPAPKESGPVGTFIGIALLWVIVFPVYMFKRARHGAGRYGAVALLGTLIFAVVSGYMLVVIETKKAEIREGLNASRRDMEQARAEWAQVAAPTEEDTTFQTATFMADQICGCTDIECAQRKAGIFNEWTATVTGPDITQAHLDFVAKEARRAEACAAALK